MSSPHSPSENRPLDQLKVTELKDELRKRGLSLKGVKKELCERLEEAIRKEEGSPYGEPKLLDEQEQVLGTTDTEGNTIAEDDQHKGEEDAVISTKDDVIISNVPLVMQDLPQNAIDLDPTCEDVEHEKGVDSMHTPNDDVISCCQGRGMSSVITDSSGLNTGTFEQEFAGDQGGDVEALNGVQICQDDDGNGQSNTEAQHNVLPMTEVTASGLDDQLLIEESNAIKSKFCKDLQVEEADAPMPENLELQEVEDVHDETCDTSQQHHSENIAQASQSEGILQSGQCPHSADNDKPLAECAIGSIREAKLEKARGVVDAEMLAETVDVPMESLVHEGMEIESKPVDSAAPDVVEECLNSKYMPMVNKEVEDSMSCLPKRDEVVELMKVEVGRPDAMIKMEELEVVDKKAELVKFEETLEIPWIIAREPDKIRTEDALDFRDIEDDSRVECRSGGFLKEVRRDAERRDAEWSLRQSELEKCKQASSKLESYMEDRQRCGHSDDIKEMDSYQFESRKRKEDASMPDRELRHQDSVKRRRWNSGNSSSGPKQLTTDVKGITHAESKDSISSVAKPETKVQDTPKSTHVTAKGELASNGDATKPRIVPPSQCPPTTSLKITKFVRPFTLKAVKELLTKFGTCVNFWMDQIKTHCYVTFFKVDEAVAARDGLYNRQWPPSFGNLLVAEFVDPQEVKIRSEGGLDTQVAPAVPRGGLPYSLPPGGPLHAVPPPPPLRERQLPPPIAKEPEPVVTLDDLFRKTEAKPHIYYLPLTGEQVKMKLEALKTKQSVRS